MVLHDLLTQSVPIHALNNVWNKSIWVDVLRIDTIHPIISGNKLFKLSHYVSDAIAKGFDTITTFGGAYSNHIVATACACHLAGIKSVGLIRGEQPDTLSPTLQEAVSFGMQLQFVSRDMYRNKAAIMQQTELADCYWIAEGGYGHLGSLGAASILTIADTLNYTHIMAACGTGTMLAGIIQAALPHQQVIGISVLKGHTGLETDIRYLLPDASQEKRFSILQDFHFGGYAKHPQQLISFMQELWQQHQLPTDIVYTSKLLFAAKTLCEQDFFEPSSKILLIHSGGLQGNRSLPQGVLPFL